MVIDDDLHDHFLIHKPFFLCFPHAAEEGSESSFGWSFGVQPGSTHHDVKSCVNIYFAFQNEYGLTLN